MTATSPNLFCTTALSMAGVSFLVIEFHRTETEAADRHCIADETEGFRRDQLRVGKVADGQIFCAEVKVFCGAV